MVWRFTTEGNESIYLLFVSVKRNSYFTWNSNQTISLWRWLPSEMLDREVVNTDRRFRGPCFLHQQCDGLINIAKKKDKKITRHIKSTRNCSLQIWFKLFYQLRRFSRNPLHFIHRLMVLLILRPLYFQKPVPFLSPDDSWEDKPYSAGFLGPVNLTEPKPQVHNNPT
jgi:hypothetical protein